MRDYMMPCGGSISDRVADDDRSDTVSGAYIRGAVVRQIDDLASGYSSDRPPDFRGPHADRQYESECRWPSYQPYQPELPPAPRYERLAPPPPATFILEPQPETVRYEDGLMTNELFDWSMQNLSETPAAPFDDWS